MAIITPGNIARLIGLSLDVVNIIQPFRKKKSKSEEEDIENLKNFATKQAEINKILSGEVQKLNRRIKLLTVLLGLTLAGLITLVVFHVLNSFS
ncbi:MAG: hypothetical protein ACLFUC_01260 [Bacteroidales bacterium]